MVATTWFRPASGGHFNPLVSLTDACFGDITAREEFAYAPVQIAG